MRGTANSGAPVPLVRVQVARGGTIATDFEQAAAQSRSNSHCCTSFDLGGRRSVPPQSQSVNVSAPLSVGKWGVSDPRSPAPYFAPGPVQRGSLTPPLRVSLVRLKRRIIAVMCRARCRAIPT